MSNRRDLGVFHSTTRLDLEALRNFNVAEELIKYTGNTLLTRR